MKESVAYSLCNFRHRNIIFYYISLSIKSLRTFKLLYDFVSRVLIMDAISSLHFRGKLSADEPLLFRMETSASKVGRLIPR